MRRALLLLLVPTAAAADTPAVTVHVTDVAGDRAYLDAGETNGIHAGDVAVFGARKLAVLDITSRTAAVKLDAPGGISPGDTGTIVPKPQAVRAPVKGPEEYREQWPPAVKPAETAGPVAQVPLGAPASPVRMTFELTAAGGVDRDGISGESELRAYGATTISGQLGADFDLGVRGFSDGYNSHERTPLLVRDAELRYGVATDPTVALGRLRYAATAVGMLDGARVATHAAGLELAAFGGITPDASSGHPDARASRFGVEAIYDRPDDAWRPRVAAVLHGSTWNGDVDERRLSLAASAGKSPAWLDGWLEVEAFSADNPWHAPSVQVTGAGASADVRTADLHAGLDLTFLRPDRSLRLDATLPDTWACTRKAMPGEVLEDCLGIDYWVAATASFGVRRARWSVDAVASVGDTHGQARYVDVSGYERTEVRAGPARVFTSLSGGRTEFADWQAIELGAGLARARWDVDVSYRPERLAYLASDGPLPGAMLLHSLVTDVRVAVSPAAAVAVSAVGTTGQDRDVLAVIAAVVWRAR